MINKKTVGLSTQIYMDLKKKIEEFEYKPGDRISEATLATIYDVSRTPIKHSLSRLENEALIIVKPQIGTFVAKIDTDHIKEFFIIRMLLELAILDEVLALRSSDLIDALQVNINSQKELLLTSSKNSEIDIARAFWKLDNDFHKLIFDSVGKGFIWDFILSQSSQFNRFRLLTVSSDLKYLNAKINEHFEILNYISKKSSYNSRDIYNVHLIDSLDNTTSRLKKKYPNYIL